MSGAVSHPATSVHPPRTRLFALIAVVSVCTGVALSVTLVPPPESLFGAALAALMILVAIIDARTFLIPNELNLCALLLGLAAAGQRSPLIAESVLMAAARGAILAAAFFALAEIYRRLRGRDGIGLGDVKLAAVAGVWLDWPFMPVAVEIAALSALAAYGIGRFILRLPLRADATLPFGLFFAPAIWVGWLLQNAFFDF
ncbi:prepilin peptidase [Methylocapsa palsarum]|uniref:Leader peptidase (Prepilin peptidase) / N-methyltransferase n=1 Tax=Methylocapsa palsarum TaxID=1612308 RepID=A0A1I3WWS0_9HYPH|nr:A24 family peptidase [Methylocapsa palsarum]SFK11387.1 leader peptidase (prepilin peptidase) / N-methyltransferase [Methylocapsa palsarum]